MNYIPGVTFQTLLANLVYCEGWKQETALLALYK